MLNSGIKCIKQSRYQVNIHLYANRIRIAKKRNKQKFQLSKYKIGHQVKGLQSKHDETNLGENKYLKVPEKRCSNIC